MNIIECTATRGREVGFGGDVQTGETRNHERTFIHKCTTLSRNCTHIEYTHTHV